MNLPLIEERGEPLAEVLAALSGASDLTRGRTPDEAMRACLVATALARGNGLSETACADVYWATLLRFAGCAATSHELAALVGGDDIAVRRRGDMVDTADVRQGLGLLHELGGLSLVLRASARIAGVAREGARADCEVGAGIARRLGLPEAVSAAIGDGFERWDGRGAPEGKRGEAVAPAARYATLAYAVVMFAEVGGTRAAVEIADRWSGRALDPALAAAFTAGADELLAAAEVDDPWAAVVAAEPGSVRMLGANGLDEVAQAFAEATDLKSPWFHGHSQAVAALAESAGGGRALRLAGLLHDLGRVIVPTGAWERPGPLTHAEWELVRLHAYHSERIIRRAPVLAPLAEIVGMHHERTDGSGYHRGASGSQLSAPARLLAAADVYAALTESRPYRPALTPAAAARSMSEQALDRDAVAAVLEAAGAPAPPKHDLPAGLTPRELEVLRLLAQGRSKRQIAAELVISPSTVHTHTVHIYEKCRVATRAGLAVFAMQHDLLQGA